jgi:hypothetical protein
MKKPLLGLLLGGSLGVLDGLSSLISAPEVAPQLVTILLGSTFKGLVAGIAIGFFSKKVHSLPIGIVAGLIIGVLMALPFALATDPETGQQYFWEIMLPGALTGMIVGFATQKYPSEVAEN